MKYLLVCCFLTYLRKYMNLRKFQLRASMLCRWEFHQEMLFQRPKIQKCSRGHAPQSPLEGVVTFASWSLPPAPPNVLAQICPWFDVHVHVVVVQLQFTCACTCRLCLISTFFTCSITDLSRKQLGCPQLVQCCLSVTH